MLGLVKGVAEKIDVPRTAASANMEADFGDLDN